MSEAVPSSEPSEPREVELLGVFLEEELAAVSPRDVGVFPLSSMDDYDDAGTKVALDVVRRSLAARDLLTVISREDYEATVVEVPDAEAAGLASVDELFGDDIYTIEAHGPLAIVLAARDNRQIHLRAHPCNSGICTRSVRERRLSTGLIRTTGSLKSSVPRIFMVSLSFPLQFPAGGRGYSRSGSRGTLFRDRKSIGNAGIRDGGNCFVNIITNLSIFGSRHPALRSRRKEDLEAGRNGQAFILDRWSGPERLWCALNFGSLRCAWICVGRVEQVAEPGDCLATEVAAEPVLVVRGEDGTIRALSAICQTVARSFPARKRAKRCVARCISGPTTSRGAWPARRAWAMPRPCGGCARRCACPMLRLELWHGFIFVNLDEDAPPLAPSLVKLEPLWAGYEATGLKALPPAMGQTPLPWNWKVQVENFTDAYHPEFVHIGTHDFAPSVMEGDGVRFTEMKPGDNAIVRSVPMRTPDGGMMSDGWGTEAAFPAIATLPAEQRRRITFAMLPPSLTIMFAPGTVAYTLIRPTGVAATFAGSDRVTYGGWLLPQSTIDLPDFMDRCKSVSQGGSKIWVCRSTSACRPPKTRASCPMASTGR